MRPEFHSMQADQPGVISGKAHVRRTSVENLNRR